MSVLARLRSLCLSEPESELSSSVPWSWLAACPYRFGLETSLVGEGDGARHLPLLVGCDFAAEPGIGAGSGAGVGVGRGAPGGRARPGRVPAWDV